MLTNILKIMLDNSIDERNKALYEELRKAGVEIEFSINPQAEVWNVRPIYKYKIESPDNVPNHAAMAHEMLHVKLNLRGFDGVLNIYKYYNERTSLFDLEFIGDFNNTLAHFKMFQSFLDMGFHVDEFLKDTPKKYFLDGIIMQIPLLILAHKAGTAKKCEEALAIIQLYTSLRFFDLYLPYKDQTTNAVLTEPLRDQLREEFPDLIGYLDGFIDEWINADTVNNKGFYDRLDWMLKQLGYPNAVDCQG